MLTGPRAASQRSAPRSKLKTQKERDEPRTQRIPAGGEPGPAAGRSLRRLGLPTHRATSDIVAGAYPFLAEAGLGSAGVYVGQDTWSGGGFCFDPWVLYEQGVLTNPNCVLAGVVGKGKSCLAKSLATRSIAVGRRVYVPGDPKGEWTSVAHVVGGAAIQVGGGSRHRLNPLDPAPRPAGVEDDAWSGEVAQRRRVLVGSLASSTPGRPLHAVEHTALDVALDRATKAPVPTLPLVVDAILDPADPFPGATVAELAREAETSGTPSAASWPGISPASSTASRPSRSIRPFQ